MGIDRQLCWPLLYGISDSLAPSIGFNWGAGNYDRVKKIVKCGFIGTAVVGIISTSALFFFPGAVASLFVDGEDVRLLELSIFLICFRERGLEVFSFKSVILF